MNDQLKQLVFDLRVEFPKFKLVPKDESKLMRFLAKLLRPVSPDFMSDFATTLGTTVYYPLEWSDGTLYEVLRHERVHMRDSAGWRALLYYPTYALLPLPLVFSGRAYWEFRGYCETLKVIWEQQGKRLDAQGKPTIWQVDWVVSQFTSSSYLWMFPFKKTLLKGFRKASLKWV